MKYKKYIPYVYIVKHKQTGLKYIGVEYSRSKKIANPDNLWAIYFTSSKLIHKLISEYGKDSFYTRVIKKFPDDPTGAMLLEQSLLTKTKTKTNYLNICKTVGFDLRTSSAAGKVGGCIAKTRQVGIFDTNNRHSYYSLGGKAGAKSQMENKIGIHAQTPEERLVFCSMGGKVGGFTMPHIQSKNGKKGGKGNAGYTWANDGMCNKKITKKMLSVATIEDILAHNNWVVGRIKETPTCPHCFKLGSSIAAMKRHHYNNCKRLYENQKG